jgi:hypothetical protein
MCAEDGIVGLDHGSGHSWCRIHSEFKLGFLAIVGREAFKQERTKS